MAPFPHTIAGQALWAWRQQAIAQALTHQVDAAEVDWLLQGVCDVDGLALRLGTVARRSTVAARFSLAELEAMWTRRLGDRVPVQHLVGETPWRQFTLTVSPAVLIPRPETELIIDYVQKAVAQHPQGQALSQGIWADLGTGSGAIALGLATVLPAAEILAVDRSEAALAIAQENAVRHGLGDRIHFLQGDWFTPLNSWRGKLAGMVSNPPYIPSALIPTLQPEVQQHEPHLALDGGTDGLDCVRHLIHAAIPYLRNDGLWMVELMEGQAQQVVAMLAATDRYSQIQICPDLTQKERFVLAHRKR